MGTITGTEISQAVRVLSHDNGATYRWSDAVHLVWLNDALRTLCTKRPEESSKEAVVTLVAGTKQQLPDEAVLLLRPVCNMGVGGATVGSSVTLADRASLELLFPLWRMDTATQDTDHVLYDPQADARRFEVYPPAVSTSTIKVLYATMPAPLAALTDPIPVNDRYANALQAYMLFRYFSVDAEDATNGQAATSYFNLFNAEVGG